MAYIKLTDKYKIICKECDINKQIKKSEWINCKRYNEIRHLYYFTCKKAIEIRKKRRSL